MKTILLIAGAALVFFFGFLVAEKYGPLKIPAGKLLVDQSFIDSLNTLKPDTIFHTDTVFGEKIVYKDRPLPEPQPTDDPEVSLLVDSIINAYTTLIIRDWIRGSLVKREVDFIPYIISKTVREPYPVIVNFPVYKDKPPNWSIYSSIITGGNTNTFMAGVEAGVITKKNTIIGGKVISDFHSKYYMFTLGHKIDF